MSITRGLPVAFKGDASSRIWQVLPVQLYYVIEGRNAWWQTWTQRYRQDCMQEYLTSAKKICERKRVQGTVFRITQLPALAFRSDVGTLFISQINTDAPFSALRMHRLEGSLQMIQQAEFMRMLDEKNNRVPSGRAQGLYFSHVEQILYAGSDNYLPSMSRENSVMVLYCCYFPQGESIGPNSKFQSWQSESFGKAYELSWSQSEKRFDLTQFYQILSEFQRQLQNEASPFFVPQEHVIFKTSSVDRFRKSIAERKKRP
jgi:hypothetical protein